jgi:predicted acylesterase/phospholipase RssA
MASDPTAELLRRETYLAPDLDCDVVMKGGITSGVVYPLAICELARRYRLVSVGGASAGAIAAVAAAAAEHGRHSSDGGFARLAALPPQIATALPDLFQPQAQTRAVFRLLTALMAKPKNRHERMQKPPVVAARFLAAFPGSGRYLIVGLLPAAAIAAIALGFEPGLFANWAPALIFGLAAVAAAAAWTVSRAWLKIVLVAVAAAAMLVAVRVWDVGEALPLAIWGGALVVAFLAGGLGSIVLAAGAAISKNSYGLVTGTKPSVGRRGSRIEPLSDWLHTVVNEAAGRSAADAPITFDDLEAGREHDPHAVRLIAMTTCLTQSRSYRIPNDFGLGSDAHERWFFDEDELRKVLPQPLVDHLVAAENAPPDPSAAQDSIEWEWLRRALLPLTPLPAPGRWPIVMAARMSLSFQILLAAVPLWKVDWSLDRNFAARRNWRADPSSTAVPRAERCWFSDGGITSNFPVHFFDTLLPLRPTFGINLREFHANREWAAQPDVPESEKVYRPERNRGGMDEWWSRFDEGKRGLGGVLAFLGALKTTALNWGDNEQMKVPGYRDRVAHISHSKDEGGMNLDMPAGVLCRLSERGRIAGEVLRDAFTLPSTPERVTDWRNHKWVRLRTSAALLDEAIRSVSVAYDGTNATGVDSYRELLRLSGTDRRSYQMTNGQRDLTRTLFEGTDEHGAAEGGLLEAAARLHAARIGTPPIRLEVGAPSPRPELRVMPGHRARETDD